jgi:hypothetical protein
MRRVNATEGNWHTVPKEMKNALAPCDPAIPTVKVPIYMLQPPRLLPEKEGEKQLANGLIKPPSAYEYEILVHMILLEPLYTRQAAVCHEGLLLHLCLTH